MVGPVEWDGDGGGGCWMKGREFFVRIDVDDGNGVAARLPCVAASQPCHDRRSLPISHPTSIPWLHPHPSPHGQIRHPFLISPAAYSSPKLPPSTEHRAPSIKCVQSSQRQPKTEDITTRPLHQLLLTGGRTLDHVSHSRLAFESGIFIIPILMQCPL